MKNLLVFLLTLIFSFSVIATGPAREAAGFTYKPTFDVYDKICASQELPSASSLKDICQVVVASEVCQDVPKEDLLQCDSLQESELDLWEFLSGCGLGILQSVEDILEFFGSILSWVWENATSGEKRGESLDKATEYAAITKLYLHTEFQKQHAKAQPPLRSIKALIGMNRAISKVVLDKVSELIAGQYEEAGCLNFKAKSKLGCQILGTILIPPGGFVALLKYGPKAVEKFSHLKQVFTKKKIIPKKDFATIVKEYPKLESTLSLIEFNAPSGKKIDKLEDIPFALSSEFRPIGTMEMGKRAKELDPETKEMLLTAYNTLNDKETAVQYFQKLFKETAEYMANKGRPEDLKRLEKGQISDHAIAVVLVKRFKERGDNGFTTIEPNPVTRLSFGKKDISPLEVNDPSVAFRTAVRTGPFFDRFFPETTSHGPYNHMIQRDIINENLSKVTKGNPQKLYDYLGTPKGINWWLDIFDSGEGTRALTRPENIGEFLKENVTGY